MIKLVHMDESAFQFFLGQATRDYAEDKISSRCLGSGDRDEAV